MAATTTQPEAPPPIHLALSRVMRDTGAVGKDQRNQQQGYAFRGIDDVMNAVHGALVKNEVVILPRIEDATYSEWTAKSGQVWTVCRLRVRYDIYGPAGDVMNAWMVSEGMDNGDKATSKAASMALKYALLQLLMIPTKDMEDPDRHAQPAREARTADDLRASIRNIAEVRQTTVEALTKKWRDKMEASMEAWEQMPADTLRPYVEGVEAWHRKTAL